MIRRAGDLLRRISIRTRLLAAYLAILALGFGVLTLTAGGQIAAGARFDYESRLATAAGFLAGALRQYVTADGAAIAVPDAVIADFESRVNATVRVLTVDMPMRGPDERDRPGISPEIDAALRGDIIVAGRPDEANQPLLFSAALIGTTTIPDTGGGGPNRSGGRSAAIVQISAPAANIQSVIVSRWLNLVVVLAVISAIAVIAALIVAQSIIRPLYTLRTAALHLARGDLSHRVAAPGSDEIGAVATAFNHMAEQVQGMLEEQRAFASNTSHELRTPLTTIRLRSEAMRHDPDLDDETLKQYIIDIDDEVRRLGALVEELTLLSRFDAGRAELGGSEIDLGRFAHSLDSALRPAADAKGIHLTITPPPTPVSLNASLTHLTVVCRNLIDNAIKYTPSGGQVTWGVSAVTPAAITFTVTDTGSGIAPEHLPHVFERFYRADKARSRSVPGTGLGLALVKSIVEAYGGTVTITSPGLQHGTTASVTWPCGHPAVPTA